jgi:hypothetical protein
MEGKMENHAVCIFPAASQFPFSGSSSAGDWPMDNQL